MCERYKLIFGHLGTAPLLLFPGLKTITLVRDPVRQIVSFWTFIRQQELHHRGHWVFPDAGFQSLEELLAYGPARRKLTNFQTRNIAEDYNPALDYRDCNGDILPFELAKFYAFHNYGDPDDPELLGKALVFRGDHEFLFSGVTSRMEESIAALAHVSGLNLGREVKHLNRSPSDEYNLTPELEADIRSITTLDQQLFEHVNRRLDETLASIAEHQ